jgi:hypothetical protein
MKKFFIFNFLYFILLINSAHCAHYPSPEKVEKQSDLLQSQEPCFDKVFPSTPSPTDSPETTSFFTLPLKLQKKPILLEDPRVCFDLTEVMINGGAVGTERFFDDNKQFNVFTFVTFHGTVMRVYKALGTQEDPEWLKLRIKLLRRLNTSENKNCPI